MPIIVNYGLHSSALLFFSIFCQSSLVFLRGRKVRSKRESFIISDSDKKHLIHHRSCSAQHKNPASPRSPAMSRAHPSPSGRPLSNPPTEFQLTGNWFVAVLVILQWHWFLLGRRCTTQDLIACVAAASRPQWACSSIWAISRCSSPLKWARGGPPTCGK